MNEPFVQITRGGAATPLPRRQTPGVPPPPPPAPGQQGGAIPQAAPSAQHHNMPAPPFHAIPPDLRGRPAVQHIDLRPECLTEGDAREILTQFRVVRFEKRATTNEVDAEGKPVKPTWLNATIRDENDIDQVNARKYIKTLDKERDKEGRTISVTEKKAAVPSTLRAQLEKQQAQLQREDDPRFVHSLVQLEDITRPLEDAKGDKKWDAKQDSKDKKKEKKYEWDKWDGKKITITDKRSKTKLKERIAVRAYFKRSPASDQDAIQLLHQQRQHQQHQREHTMMMMMQDQQRHHAQMQPPQLPPQQLPPQQHAKADVQVVQPLDKKGKFSPKSFHSSDTSSYSDGFSESEGEYDTPQSSVGSHLDGKHRHRHRERKHHKDSKKYYNAVPRTVPVAEGLYLITTTPRGLTPATPLSPQPRLPPPVEIDRLRNVRYWDSEAQYAAERREREEGTRRRAIEPAHTYRTVERQRSYPRMSPLENRRERLDDFDYDREHRDAIARDAIASFDRLALEDEERERERRLEDASFHRALRDRLRTPRVAVTADGPPYEHESERVYAPYIKTHGPTYMDHEARAEDYIERRSATYESHPFAPRPRQPVYEERFR